MLSLPRVSPKRKGKSIVFTYALEIYICKSCIKSLNRWVEIETKGMKSMREGFLDLCSRGKVILRTRWFNIWFVKR